MTSDPKPTTYRNQKYLSYIRKKDCIFPGCTDKDVDAHHVRRSFWGAGMGKKPHDYVTIPLCRYHHEAGSEEVLAVYDSIIRYLTEYIGKDEDPDMIIITALMEYAEGEKNVRNKRPKVFGFNGYKKTF